MKKRKISGNYLKNLTKIINYLNDVDNFNLVYKVKKNENLQKVGFKKELEEGDQILPANIGKSTKVNSSGKIVVQKHLPKKKVEIQYPSRWKDFHGNWHYGMITREVEKYPRKKIKAPEEALSVIKINGDLYISTKKISFNKNTNENILHIANVMLECFGEFEILNNENNEILTTKIRKLNWSILPIGEIPWEKTNDILDKMIKNFKKSRREVIKNNFKKIMRHNPDFSAVGNGGFSGYFIYGFKQKEIYILESIYLNNATYVFKEDWEFLSKLKKSEIINGKNNYLRIIHNNNWDKELSDVFISF